MAKSIRASVSKRNRANLRKKVFGPVVDARTERLAAKLNKIASQPRPSQEKPSTEESSAAGTFIKEIIGDSTDLTSLPQVRSLVVRPSPIMLRVSWISIAEESYSPIARKANGFLEMDIDTKSSKGRNQKAGRVQKRNRKPRNCIVFQKRPSKKGSQGKK